MDSWTVLPARLLRTALEPGVLMGVAALLLATLAAAISARALSRAARTRLAGATQSVAGSWRALLGEGLSIGTPYGAALVTLAVLRALLAASGLETSFLDRILPLLGALILIRASVFLLRLSLGPRSRMRHWEARAALLVWLFVAMHMLQWLEAFIALLDSVRVAFTARGEAPITLWSVLKSLFTVIVFVIVSAWVGRWMERRISEVQGLAPGTRIAVAKFSYAFLIGFGALVGLAASGLNLGALSFFGGALGLGLGFGLQSIAANFVSGFVLLMDKSIKPGDVISFTGTLGTSTEGFGWVQELRGRYVVVRDRDGVETLVPNQNLITNQVINWSYSDRRVRLKLPVRISYDDDPEAAMQVLLRAAEGHRRILRDPMPVARLMSFHDYGMDLELRFWIADPQEGVNNVRSDVNRAIWRLFKDNGITIPRAQMEVRVAHAEPRLPAGPRAAPP